MNYGIILAGGKGSRMHSKTAKCAVPILGKPMINYILEAIQKTNINQIICVLGNHHNQFHLPDGIGSVIQEKPLGTADAVKTALQSISNDEGDTLIIPGDVPFLETKTINEMMTLHRENKNVLTIGTIRVSLPKGYGRVVREKNRIIRIVEEKDASEEEKKIQEVYCGVMCIRTRILKEYISLIQNDNAQHEFYLTDLVELISNKFNVGSYEIEDVFQAQGINDLPTLIRLEKEYQVRIINKHIQAGVRFENIDSVTIGPNVEFVGEVFVRVGSVITGKSVLYSGVTVGPNTEIVDSIIYEDVVVAHSVIDQSIIHKNSKICPYAHIRNDSNIGENNRIGNFVEIKNTTTGLKTYASHLAYIGDTECGSGVNFGCGIVTVNYDGVNKHKTKIGSNVFIGCNSNLIAPIEIASNSYIAAGSTITKDLAVGDFAIARAKQITKSEYANKFHYKRVDEE